MDLYSKNPFWLLKSGILGNYSPITTNKKTEVVIMGAGITGSLVAWYLCKKGFDVIMVDKRHAGMGSTAASTSLLQYEIDTPLSQLIKYVGVQNAVRSYQLCLKAIPDLNDICKELKTKTDFEFTQSLQFASYKKHVKDLRTEFETRKKYGIKLDWLSEHDVKVKFGFSAPAALLSKMGGQVDAYRLTHAILKACQHKGLSIGDTTEIVDISYHHNGVHLRTAQGNKISAKYLIIACGYESRKFIPKKIDELHSTYALISKPLLRSKQWYQNCLLWETAKPYLYLRTTSDNRIIIGGKDDAFYNPSLRDAAVPLKAERLEKAMHGLFPGIPFEKDFAWGGTFSVTSDGLPYIGKIRQRPNTFFALGFGGNGITFSVIAAQIIMDLLMGKKNKDQLIFSFTR